MIPDARKPYTAPTIREIKLPSGMALVEARLIVAKFAELMEVKLRENDHKGGWEYETTRYLLSRLGDEVAELRRRVGAWNDLRVQPWPSKPEQEARTCEIAREAADVANFAMMIADVCGGLK